MGNGVQLTVLVNAGIGGEGIDSIMRGGDRNSRSATEQARQRHISILVDVSLGMMNREIAARQSCSVDCVRKYLIGLYREFDWPLYNYFGNRMRLAANLALFRTEQAPQNSPQSLRLKLYAG